MASKASYRLIGIDPGSVRTGVGIVAINGRDIEHLHHCELKIGGEDFPQRLAAIFSGVGDLIASYQPTVLAIENVFVSRNPQSALKLGQARGAAICAAVSQGLSVHEYAPREIKNAVVGTGRADKAQVQHMVRLLLKLDQSPGSDAADALAVAICHHNTASTLGGLNITASQWRRRR